MSESGHFDSANLTVLHTLRCMGFTTVARVAEATALDESDAESDLIDLAVAGLVTKVPGEFGGWGLTDAGRAADAEQRAAELDKSGARPGLTAAFEKFLVLNPELLDLCTAWQMRSNDGTVRMNDHTDKAYDSRVLSRLVEFNDRAGAVCAELAAVVHRFERYRTRLSGALARVQSGELDYVTDNLSSYHNIWFQLHEDLLVTLGIPRH